MIPDRRFGRRSEGHLRRCSICARVTGLPHGFCCKFAPPISYLFDISLIVPYNLAHHTGARLTITGFSCSPCAHYHNDYLRENSTLNPASTCMYSGVGCAGFARNFGTITGTKYRQGHATPVFAWDTWRRLIRWLRFAITPYSLGVKVAHGDWLNLATNRQLCHF